MTKEQEEFAVATAQMRRIVHAGTTISVVCLWFLGAIAMALLNVYDGWYQTILSFVVLYATAVIADLAVDLVRETRVYHHVVLLAEFSAYPGAEAFCREHRLKTIIFKIGDWPVYTFRHERDAVAFKLMFG